VRIKAVLTLDDEACGTPTGAATATTGAGSVGQDPAQV
jgi:hypothetical protein